MTKQELEDAFELNDSRINLVSIIIVTSCFDEHVQARAKRVETELKKERHRLEQIGRELCMQSHIEKLEQLERELGIGKES